MLYLRPFPGFAGDIWSVGGGHLVSSRGTSGQFVRRAPKLVREAADTLSKGRKVSFQGTESQFLMGKMSAFRGQKVSF